MITGPDHFVLLVNDLNAAIKTWRDLGFEAQPGGGYSISRTSSGRSSLRPWSSTARKR